jgi:pimeloyl-ACP methyl ester carboxylesterase
MRRPARSFPACTRRRLAASLAAAALLVPALGALAQAVPPPTTAPGVPPKQPPKTPAPSIPLTPLARVEVRGSGPIPMILIPGAACDWSVFDTFMTRNASKYTMYAVTLPGFGGSTAPPTTLGTPPTSDSWLTNAELAILKLVEEQKLDHPVIAGHSMGGHIAYRLAARHGDVFRAAVIIDGLTWVPLQDLSKGNLTVDDRRTMVDNKLKGTFLHQRTDAKWQQEAAESAPQLAKDAARGEQIAKMMGAVPSAVIGRYFLEYVAGDLTGEVSQIEIPTLSIIAISDMENALRPKAAQKSMRMAQIADAKAVTAVIFEDTRHMVMDERPEELDAVISAFLTGKPVPGAVKTGTTFNPGAVKK